MDTENDPFAKFRAKPGANRPQPKPEPSPAAPRPQPEPSHPAESEPKPAPDRAQTRAAAAEAAEWAAAVWAAHQENAQGADASQSASQQTPPQPKVKPESAASKPTSTKPDHEPMDAERRKNLIAGFSTLGVVAMAIIFVLFTVFGPKPTPQKADGESTEQTDDASETTDNSSEDENGTSDKDEDEDEDDSDDTGVFINDFLSSEITDELDSYDLNSDGVLTEKEARYLTNLSLDTISSGDLATLAELPSIKVLSLQEVSDELDFMHAPELEELTINNLSARSLDLRGVTTFKKISIGIAPSVYQDGPIDAIYATNMPDLESFEITNPTTFDDHIAVKILDLTRDAGLKTLGIYRTVDTLNLSGCSDTFEVEISLATVNRVVYDADTDVDSLNMFQQDRAESDHPTTFEED